jgi:hypothetical protein
MIRPLDLQTTLLAAHNAPAALQRAQEGPRLDAQAAQAAFAAELTHRDESVAAMSEAAGNRIGAKPEEREPGSRKRKRKAATPFEQVVEDAADSAEEPPHIVDFTA